MFPATPKDVSVPKLVSADVVTVLCKFVPVNVLASAGTVISTVPSNPTPLIFLGVDSLCAAAAVPLSVAPIKFAAVTLPVNVPVSPVMLPVTLPTKSDVISFAAKLPVVSLATTLPI